MMICEYSMAGAVLIVTIMAAVAAGTVLVFSWIGTLITRRKPLQAGAQQSAAMVGLGIFSSFFTAWGVLALLMDC